MTEAELIAKVKTGEADDAICELLKSSYKIECSGRALIKFTNGHFWYVWDECRERSGDPHETGEEEIVYQRETSGYDSMPSSFRVKDSEDFSWAIDADGEGKYFTGDDVIPVKCTLTSGGYEIYCDAGWTVNTAIEDWIHETVSSEYEEFREDVIQYIEDYVDASCLVSMSSSELKKIQDELGMTNKGVAKICVRSTSLINQYKGKTAPIPDRVASDIRSYLEKHREWIKARLG